MNKTLRKSRSIRTAVKTLPVILTACLSTPLLAANAPTTEPGIVFGTGRPTTNPSAMTPEQLALNSKINAQLKILGGDLKDLRAALPEKSYSDPAKRNAAAAVAIVDLKKIIADTDQITAISPQIGSRLSAQRLRSLAMLATLGDKTAVDQIQTMSKSADPQESLRGQGGQLLVRWYSANGNPAAEALVVDDVEKLDRANPTDQDLTYMTRDMSNVASTPQLADRLITIASEEMNNWEASLIKKKLARAKFSATDKPTGKIRTEDLVDKPLTISETDVDAKPFSTADLKGKVILVDFWATWCGPCKAELPRVKEMYEKYHAQGLEVVGVSNDFKPELLRAYITDNKMPWPQLLDARAAAAFTWNPVTTHFGINAIPVMMLIDKKGVVRSITARKDMETMIPKLMAE
jgi:thiol-disulfide isomerase/thioredoxin